MDIYVNYPLHPYGMVLSYALGQLKFVFIREFTEAGWSERVPCFVLYVREFIKMPLAILWSITAWSDRHC